MNLLIRNRSERSRLLPAGLVSAFALLLLLPGGLWAQDAPPPPPPNAPAPSNPGGPPPRDGHRMNPERQLKHMTKMLNLTSDQQQQILPVLQDRDQQMQALMANSSLSQRDRRKQMRSIGESSKQKLEAVLNDQQKQQFEDMQAKQRQRMQEHRQQMQQNNAPPADGTQPPPPPANGGQPQ